jgi:hypothetical protein
MSRCRAPYAVAAVLVSHSLTWTVIPNQATRRG